MNEDKSEQARRIYSWVRKNVKYPTPNYVERRNKAMRKRIRHNVFNCSDSVGEEY